MNVEAPRARAIFLDAVERHEPEQWPRYLGEACAGDDLLRLRVEALLRAHARSAGLLDNLGSGPNASADPLSAAERTGTTIGPYKLMEQIGEGGMGVVYVAEQSQPVRRRVALKVVKPGMDTKQVIARFEAERQALAMMDHPNIAKVHDAGATESGHPYFVMELVRGIPITEYCDREQLSVPERLDLFVLVCRAVQHAHQKGIIHRDLKPSNILVTVIDGAPVPKIIDFGVAKATGGALTDRTIYTNLHQVVGTPLYMSPEQADLSGMDVDTRSDIYSLGVLLYELLTGTTPFDQDTFRQAAFDEIRRIIREDEPPKPSTRLSSLGETRSTVSANRKTGARHLNRAVHGELDWIVMKALEKDRRRRYETANDFAADVMRHLTDQPVEACPPSTWYRLAKSARRNRVILTAAALIGIAVIGGTAVSVWQASKAKKAATAAKKAAAEATLRADESRHVVDYLVNDVFGATVPGKGRSRYVTVGELLDRADATAGDRFRGQPLVEASVRVALARTYRALANGQRAELHAIRATELRALYLGPDHTDTVQAMAEQALAYSPMLPPKAKTDEFVANVRRVFEAHRRVLGRAHPETLGMQLLLASYLDRLERFDEARIEAVEAEALAVRALGPNHPLSLGAGGMLGWTVFHGGDGEGAAVLMRRNFEGNERILGPLHPDTVGALANLTLLQMNRGRFDEYLPLQVETYRRCKELYGINEGQTIVARRQVIAALRQQRDYAALREFWEGEVRELLMTPVGPDLFPREQVAESLNRLVWDLVSFPEPNAIDAQTCVQTVEKAIEMMPKASNIWNTLGVAYYRAGDWAGAIKALVKSEALAPDKDFGINGFFLAMAHWRMDQKVKARECYDHAVEWMVKNKRQDAQLLRFRAEAEELLGINAK
jgi:eukaryotic-like serine/threonine-protein kinase